MKTIALILMFVAFTGVTMAAPDETSFRKILAAHRADYAYRFSSWSSAEHADSFVVTFCFFLSVDEDKKDYSAHQSGMPIPSRAEIEIVVTRRGEIVTSTKILDQKEADDMLCRFGYAGFSAQDSEDAVHDVFDGHGLVGERLYKGVYSTRTRKYEEHLACEWLYDYLQKYTKKG